MLRRDRGRLQDLSVKRSYGFFYNGLEPDLCYGEIYVKKLDLLLIYVVAYTQLVHEARAKLMLLAAIAGIFWSTQNLCRPFDDRQNSLLDRV